ncbi:hypothetical protein M752DRAFT_95079 [Aspergillus phoenicis ATCC 13157]|uniref:Secreted protein n=1 Tax=Aspergillus phoenicis ATCC 13157 TaxID=1353007 RepID=A0A370P620_ASPPH|nr:hypothetical protein M752DRAFT_95079 [Aspergillus phoenicis ATCC 13157]
MLFLFLSLFLSSYLQPNTLHRPIGDFHQHPCSVPALPCPSSQNHSFYCLPSRLPYPQYSRPGCAGCTWCCLASTSYTCFYIPVSLWLIHSKFSDTLSRILPRENSSCT